MNSFFYIDLLSLMIFLEKIFFGPSFLVRCLLIFKKWWWERSKSQRDHRRIKWVITRIARGILWKQWRWVSYLFVEFFSLITVCYAWFFSWIILEKNVLLKTFFSLPWIPFFCLDCHHWWSLWNKSFACLQFCSMFYFGRNGGEQCERETAESACSSRAEEKLNVDEEKGWVFLCFFQGKKPNEKNVLLKTFFSNKIFVLISLLFFQIEINKRLVLTATTTTTNYTWKVFASTMK